MTTRVDKKPSTTKRMIWMIVGVLAADRRDRRHQGAAGDADDPLHAPAGAVGGQHGQGRPAGLAAVAERGRHAARRQRRRPGDGRRRPGHRREPEVRPGREAGPGAAAAARRRRRRPAAAAAGQRAAVEDHLRPRSPAARCAGHQQGRLRQRCRRLQGAPGRGGPADRGGGQEAAARAVRRPRRHHHHQPRRLSQRRHRGGHAAAARSAVRRLQRAAERAGPPAR